MRVVKVEDYYRRLQHRHPISIASSSTDLRIPGEAKLIARGISARLHTRFNRYGLLDNDPDFHRDRLHSVSLGQNLLQQRTFCKSVTPNTGHYGNSVLLDDVGNCVSCTDETANCSNPQWRVRSSAEELRI
ncbi:hypothetical protein NE237_001915 [Protea cynaroides]|uniref:Uncharacterized protein n=1 Tax=Protea cynaroides TaxID=273540 RepID=A0A9Q0KV16_9MAGN|nr:hypothetical protein NE237_001915 [Protea cynaroides]